MAVYAAMIDRLDQGIGRVLQTVRALGKEQNTFVIFLSDNGGSAGSLHFGADVPSNLPVLPPGPMDSFHTIDGPWADVSNVPFRYYKDTTFEGGISTPTIVSWPAALKAKRNHHSSDCGRNGHNADLSRDRGRALPSHKCWASHSSNGRYVPDADSGRKRKSAV